MFSFLKRFNQNRIWDFDGGIHPPEMKTQSSGTPLRQVPLPPQLVIPLKQHIGDEGELCIKVGDHVLRGQPLTRGWGRMLPVHAPTSGTISAITHHITAHPSGLTEPSVIIMADGEDRWFERDGWSDYAERPRADLIERIHQFGVAGLGGAGFPTATKLRGGGDNINTLIINAAECEPYITADDRLMQDCAAQIVEGIRILAFILQPEKTLIGIEDNKPQAISMLRAVLAGSDDIQLRVIPTKYPSGGAKQLTQILTGKQVPHGGRSSDIGILMQNVGTAYAIKRAIIDGEPLTERVVTLTGGSVQQPGNVWARLGTPVEHLMTFAHFRPGREQKVIMGGPLMGFTLPALDVPVVKITNCLLAPSVEEMAPPQEEQGCIRCSACADACPADLLPQQLYWFSKGQQHDKAASYNLSDCIECGACAWVCPSNIPLIQYFRQEKAEIREIELEAKRTAEAKVRFEARQARLDRDKAARQERHKSAAVQPSSQDNSAIKAALARVQSTKSLPSGAVIVIKAGTVPDNSDVIASREARKALARTRQAGKDRIADATANTIPTVTSQTDLNTEGADPRKSAVEAAIARAKARKQQQAEPAVTETSAEAIDPRKAAVEAAIARAKARKQQQAEPAVTETPAEAIDPRKAAVEAAIARAKARKQQQAEPTVTETPAEAIDPRKAAVEAAIARAKARKQQQAEPAVTETPAEAIDPRKAAVEAAIARAKARKQQQAEPTVTETPAEAIDPRKAAVEAAIARAKARKQQQAEPAVTETPAEAIDPRKAAVEAAIARAKARKQQQAESTVTETPVEAIDPRKAAVEAAIARAQARKAAQMSSEE